MKSEEDVSKLDKLNQKMEQVKDSKFSIPIYVATIFVASLWLIFVNPCLMNLLLPIIAILIPYKLYNEADLKKIIAAGIIVIILLSASTTLFQLGFIYDQPPQTLRSDNLRDGTVEPLYGDSSTSFNFTVNVTENFAENWDPEDYTVCVNLTLSTVAGIGREAYEGYEMNSTGNGRQYYKELTLEERLFGHRFSIKRNMTDETTYLFSLNRTKYERYLEEGPINETLTEVFVDEGYEVEDNASLSIGDEKWFISEQGKKEYRIKAVDENLNIYKMNGTEEDGLEGPFYSWERTSVGYGPVTIERMRAFQLLVGEYIISTSVLYLLGIGLLWWKKRMDSSVEESTEGLKEKEKELEDHCPECGTLLEGSDTCEECGWERKIEKEEPTDEKDMDL